MIMIVYLYYHDLFYTVLISKINSFYFSVRFANTTNFPDIRCCVAQGSVSVLQQFTPAFRLHSITNIYLYYALLCYVCLGRE